MASDDSGVVKKPMTEAERLQLAKKLDEELDEFIDGLEHKRYEDGWPEDKWQEEMEKHPFFMKAAPQDGQEMSPLAEGLARLKFDPEENTPTELALNYKEDGNFNFKHKNYRLAIIGYTEGIKVKCGDRNVEASLYNNRAACNWELKNYRSCLSDCEKAIALQSDHRKARTRAVHSAMATSKFDVAIKHAQTLLGETPDNESLMKILSDAKKEKSIYMREKRKKSIADKKKTSENDELLSAIIARGVKIDKVEDADDLDLSDLEPTIPAALNLRVKLEDGTLLWPLLILYPEFNVTDFIGRCPEDVPLISQLEQLFPAPWDEGNSYGVSNVNVYYEGSNGKAALVDPTLNLADVLKLRYFVVRGGTPSFFVLVAGSEAEKSFLKNNS